MENKMLEKTREALEEHIQLIIRKGGNMTPPDIEILTKDLCALEALNRIEQGEFQNSFQANGNSYRRGRGANGQFVSRDSGNSGYYGDGSSTRSHDGGNSNRYYDGAGTRPSPRLYTLRHTDKPLRTQEGYTCQTNSPARKGFFYTHNRPQETMRYSLRHGFRNCAAR